MEDFEQFPPIEGNGHPTSGYLLLVAAIALGLTALVLSLIG